MVGSKVRPVGMYVGSKAKRTLIPYSAWVHTAVKSVSHI